MNKRIKRVFALLAAVFLFISLPLSVSAILLNPDPKDQVYNWDDMPPHVYEEGSTFWLNQPFHAYWHVEGYEEFGEDQSSGENRMIYNMIDYYWSGDCHFFSRETRVQLCYKSKCGVSSYNNTELGSSENKRKNVRYYERTLLHRLGFDRNHFGYWLY